MARAKYSSPSRQKAFAFINTGKREDAAAGADNDVNGADSVPVPPADFPQDEKEDLPF